jgi:hypothetical protein
MGHRTDPRRYAVAAAGPAAIQKHVNLGAVMADVLKLPEDVDREGMFAAAIGARRNSRFSRVAKLWLKGKECAYCERKADEAHHIYPFWLFPSLEMDDRFWLPVCRTGEDHHVHQAHLGSFERFDVLAKEHAAIFKFCRRQSEMFVKLVKAAEKSPKARRELNQMLAELAGIAA